MKPYLLLAFLCALPLMAQDADNPAADVPAEPLDAPADAAVAEAGAEVAAEDDENAPVPAPQPPNLQGGGPVDPQAIHTPEGFKLERLVMTGFDAADLYARVTGKRVIVSRAAGEIETRFVQRGPLTNADVARLLEKTLILEGLAFVPDSVNPDEVKLVVSGPVTNPNAVGFNVITDEATLPQGDQIVTYLMTFNNLKPDEALRIFQQVVGQFGGTNTSGKIAAVTNASSLIITENSGLIRQLIKIQKEIDVPSGVNGERWVEVKYADVEAIATQLNDIFGFQQSQTSARVQRQQNRGNNNNNNNNNQANAGSEGLGEETPLHILPDVRTNRILLVGRPADLMYVESLIKGYDQPSDGRNYYTRKLRYLRVNEFIGVAADAIERTLGTLDEQGQQAGNQRQQQNNNQNRNVNNNNGGGANSGQAGGGASAQANIQDIPTAPEAITVGKTLLVADNLSNSIIVQGPPHHIEIVQNLIGELDSETEQVAISAVIGSYQLGRNINFGIDLANIVQGTTRSMNLGGTLRAGVPSVVDPSTLGDLASMLAANGAAGNGVSLYGTIGNEFGLFINALEANTKFKALATPTVFTKNNRVATLSSGQRIAIPSSTYTG
ncbi:MAG: secretin N-terminal domain-containing protein, partial [Verrucomicrobiales bacterium]